MKSNKETDHRKTPPAAVYELKKVALKLRKNNKTVKEMSEFTGLSDQTVRNLFRQYDNGGLSAIKPKTRGRKQGEKRHLTPKQEKEIFSMLIDKNPDQLKLKGCLWMRDNVSDFTPHELEDMISNKDNDLPNESNCNHLEFIGAKDWNEYERTYDSCNINYYIFENRYDFTLWWYKKGTFGNCSHSTGEPGTLTFDTPLEFTDYFGPEALGKMIIEALDRSRKISDKVAGNPYPEKTIELLSGTTMIVSAPRDKHFSDCEDYGVGELHQAYLYFPKEGEDSSAEFYLGIAAELDCNLSEDNIRNAWEKLHGKAEFFEVKSVEHGIWNLRAEMRNKSVHRISYLLQIDESELLDCTMELHKPNTRKKLDEKLTAMFEKFARQCKFKD